MRFPGFSCALALAVATAASGAAAQSLADLRNDAATPANVTTYGMGWGQQRYSPLRQINEHTRRTSPPAVRERPNMLGTARSPTSRQAPFSEISRT